MSESSILTSKPCITVLLVDDHALVRRTLETCLRETDGIQVVGSAADAADAVEQAGRLKPDVILMDIDMPGMGCFEAVRTIRARWPEIRIVFLSAFFNDRYIEQALAVEASGYLTKNEPPEAVVQAVRGVMVGSPYYSPEILTRIVVTPEGAMLPPERRSQASLLTERELEVLQCLARGMSKKEIAKHLHISVNTVNRHTDNIMNKVNIHDRVQLVRFAIREGLADA